ncbi:MAG: hypothetical protein JW862_06405 [Anaerolineales bacterium]|nr:hypothetical protein [Anaerolineales bacterium]
MTPNASRTPLWLRLAGILLSGLGLLWLPFEDSHTHTVLALGSLTCVWFGLYFLHPIQVDSWKGFALHILAGTLAGMAVIPITLLLMALKTGLHAHPQPDFSGLQITSLLNRLPIWTTTGLVVGLALGWWRYQKSQ